MSWGQGSYRSHSIRPYLLWLCGVLGRSNTHGTIIRCVKHTKQTQMNEQSLLGRCGCIPSGKPLGRCGCIPSGMPLGRCGCIPSRKPQSNCHGMLLLQSMGQWPLHDATFTWRHWARAAIGAIAYGCSLLGSYGALGCSRTVHMSSDHNTQNNTSTTTTFAARLLMILALSMSPWCALEIIRIAKARLLLMVAHSMSQWRAHISVDFCDSRSLRGFW